MEERGSRKFEIKELVTNYQKMKVNNRRSLLEGVVGVTLLKFVVFDTEDSGVEGILGDISEEESRYFEIFSTGYL